LRRERCFWMIPARARRASFASAGLGNAAATSGSSTITALPAAYRDAYLLREARLKSYSGRISSASVRLVTPLLLVALFIVPSLAADAQVAPTADPRQHDQHNTAAHAELNLLLPPMCARHAPEERKIIAHGASRWERAVQSYSPGTGRKTRQAAPFRPVPGLEREQSVSARLTPWATF